MSSSAKRPVRQRGFTLVELLVAITVLAIVAVLGWRGLDAIVRARVALTADLEQTRGMQLAFAQLQNDCARIADGRELRNRPTLQAEPNRLTLVRNVFADNQPTRVQVVAYRVVDGKLERRESVPVRDIRELDTQWTAALADSDRNQPVPLQEKVISMNLRTWSGTAGWQANASSNQPSPLPPGSVPPVQTPGGQTGGQSGGQGGGQGSGQPNPNNVPLAQPQTDMRGVEVALQLDGRERPMYKIFLLGAE